MTSETYSSMHLHIIVFQGIVNICIYCFQEFGNICIYICSHKDKEEDISLLSPADLVAAAAEGYGQLRGAFFVPRVGYLHRNCVQLAQTL